MFQYLVLRMKGEFVPVGDGPGAGNVLPCAWETLVASLFQVGDLRSLTKDLKDDKSGYASRTSHVAASAGTVCVIVYASNPALPFPHGSSCMCRASASSLSSPAPQAPRSRNQFYRWIVTDGAELEPPHPPGTGYFNGFGLRGQVAGEEIPTGILKLARRRRLFSPDGTDLGGTGLEDETDATVFAEIFLARGKFAFIKAAPKKGKEEEEEEEEGVRLAVAAVVRRRPRRRRRPR